ncbi:ankyrin repeat domain-containing protein SOWAHD [Gouania willdenowi]|nr:ankyrin repeat domain-containing protein SOWAHD [Gouania willdenowi]
METDPSTDPGLDPGSVVDRLSRYGVPVLPGSFQRRWRHSGGVSAPERSSITPAMRKKYLKELLLNDPAHSGLSRVLSSPTACASADQDVDWALYPMEHAWMLSAVEGSFETILEFISEDPQLLSRRDLVSGYSVLHWLAKRGQHETLVKVLRYARTAGIPVNVNVRGSGGLTPLHVATMHGHVMVIKLLVGAYGADVDAMDHGGRRAWQYLRTDAPPEMKELLGAWDLHGNANNNCACVGATGPCEEGVSSTKEEVVDYFDRTRRVGSWRFGSLRKLLPSSFYGKLQK